MDQFNSKLKIVHAARRVTYAAALCAVSTSLVFAQDGSLKAIGEPILLVADFPPTPPVGQSEVPDVMPPAIIQQPDNTGQSALPLPQMDGNQTVIGQVPLQNLSEKAKQLIAQIDGLGVNKVAGNRLIVPACNGCIPLIINCRDQISDVSGLKGKSVRVNDFNKAFVSSLGAVPVGLPGGEIYVALESGVIECTVSGGNPE